MTIDTSGSHARSSALLRRYSGSPVPSRYKSGDGKLLLLCTIVLFLISVFAYGYTIYFGFAGADYTSLLNNERWRVASIVDIVINPHRPLVDYQPLVDLSYRLTYQLFGLEAPIFHLQNVILHSLASLALFFVLLHLFAPVTSLLASLLFAVMPIHTEAVSNISGRPFLLMSSLGLMALYLALVEARSQEEPLSPVSGFVVLLCFLGALLSHEAAVALIGIFLLSYYYLPEEERSPEHAKSLILILFCALFIFVALRFLATGAIYPLSIRPIEPIDNPFRALAPPDRFLNGLILLGRAFLLALAPSRLSVDYSLGALTHLGGGISEATVAHLLTAITLLVLSIWGTQRKNIAGFCSAWFIIATLPTSNILFTVPFGFTEPYVYLASAGVGIMVAGGIEKVRSRFIRQATVGLYVSFLLIFTILHNRAWINDATLWTRQASLTPEGAKSTYHLALALESNFRRDEEAKRVQRRSKEGIKRLNEILTVIQGALNLYPGYAEALLLKGRILRALGDEKNAEKAFVVAADESVLSLEPRWKLAEYYIGLEKWDHATVALERAYQVEPRSVTTNILFVRLGIKKGDAELGRRHVRILRDLYTGNTDVLLIMQEYYTRFPT